MKKKQFTTKFVILVGACLLISILATILLFNVTDYGITIASFAATVFMVISRKKINTKKIFGSYLLVALLGYIYSVLPTPKLFNVAAVTVSSVLFMILVGLQHAPAIGIAIALVLNNFTFWNNVIIMSCIFLILGISLLLRELLKNPDKISNFVKIETEKIHWNF